MSWITLLQNNSTIRWAGGGWLLFIAENFLLSENRTVIIQELGDESYHALYGTLSTVATASIGYAYLMIRKNLNHPTNGIPKQLMLWKTKTPPILSAFGGWLFLTVGLTMASQAIPKMQIPFAMVGESVMPQATDVRNSEGPSTAGETPVRNYRLQVRCPFDFREKKRDDQQLHGVEYVSRHPGLWSMGLVGLGQSLLVPSIPQRIWWMGPAAVAWIGGAHTDSRFRRNMGGTLTPEYDSQTSNVPFWAMVCGKQGSDAMAHFFSNELKPLNAGMALAMSTLWVARRMR